MGVDGAGERFGNLIWRGQGKRRFDEDSVPAMGRHQAKRGHDRDSPLMSQAKESRGHASGLSGDRDGFAAGPIAVQKNHEMAIAPESFSNGPSERRIFGIERADPNTESQTLAKFTEALSTGGTGDAIGGAPGGQPRRQEFPMSQVGGNDKASSVQNLWVWGIHTSEKRGAQREEVIEKPGVVGRFPEADRQSSRRGKDPAWQKGGAEACGKNSRVRVQPAYHDRT